MTGRRRRGPAAAVGLLLAACAPLPPMPELPRTHPASPAADEAPERAPAQTLQMPTRTPRAAAPGAARRGH